MEKLAFIFRAPLDDWGKGVDPCYGLHPQAVIPAVVGEDPSFLCPHGNRTRDSCQLPAGMTGQDGQDTSKDPDFTRLCLKDAVFTYTIQNPTLFPLNFPLRFDFDIAIPCSVINSKKNVLKRNPFLLFSS